MKILVIGFVMFGLLLSFCMYCCIRVGAQEDRWLESLERKGESDAG